MKMTSSTHLFDGLNLGQAIEVYHRVSQEARKIEDPMGEEVKFFSFTVTPGVLWGPKLYPTSWAPREVILQAGLGTREVSSAGEYVAYFLKYAMEIELAGVAKLELEAQQGRFRAYAQDVTKLGGYSSEATTLEDAKEAMLASGRGIAGEARGNAVVESAIDVEGLGYFVYPPFGATRFVPTATPSAMTEQEFLRIVGRYPAELDEIRRLWGHIAHATRRMGWFETLFVFGGETYYVFHNPNRAGVPDWSKICSDPSGHYGVGLLSAFRSGLLAAWAKSLGLE